MQAFPPLCLLKGHSIHADVPEFYLLLLGLPSWKIMKELEGWISDESE